MTSSLAKSQARRSIVFLFDVDNTLLDNDRIIADLEKHLRREVGPQPAKRYWALFDQLRTKLGYADYLGALQLYRRDHPRDLRLLTISRFLIDYPFAHRLFPEALAVLRWAKRGGTVALLTDGDVVFQPHKIECSGLGRMVSAPPLIYVHKEHELDDVVTRFPADHYVLVDDKLRILAAVKKLWGRRVTTVFVRQGHYAFEPKLAERFPAADVTIDRIGELLTHRGSEFTGQPSEVAEPLRRVRRAP